MKEQGSSSALRPIVLHSLKRHAAFAVENICQSGTPDVCSTLGWIELKCVDSFPATENGRLNVGMRRSQALWHRRWRRRGGSSLILTVVGNEWFVHDGLWAADHMESMTSREFQDAAITIWTNRPTDEILRSTLERLHESQI